VIEVEREPDGHSAARRVGERARDETSGGLLEVEVVEGEIERLARAGDELAGVFGDLEGALAPVGQCADVDRQA
jgi:hypothetical protein